MRTNVEQTNLKIFFYLYVSTNPTSSNLALKIGPQGQKGEDVPSLKVKVNSLSSISHIDY